MFRLWTRAHGRYMRSTANYLNKRPLTISTRVPLISFTFDDFPRSALYIGGAILKRFGLAGTYYASFGLMGGQAPTGTMFLHEDLTLLLGQGHELGCHTFDHYDSWKTSPSDFERSVIANRQKLLELCPGQSFRSFSYPINPPKARTKKRMARHFLCCRGGGQTFNKGTADLNYLTAYFLEQSRGDLRAVTDLIEENNRAKGWLILATHDISKSPTAWGCTPEFFEAIVEHAVNSGSRILPVIQAWEAIRNCASTREPDLKPVVAA